MPSNDPLSIPPEVHQAWERGDKVSAIRLLREATGLGLAECKQALESNLAPVPVREAAAFPAASPLPESVRSAIAAGHKVEAIRLLREEVAGLSLKDAKDVIDAAHAEMAKHAGTGAAGSGAFAEGLSPGQVPQRGFGAGALIVAAIVALVVWLLFFRSG